MTELCSTRRLLLAGIFAMTVLNGRSANAGETDWRSNLVAVPLVPDVGPSIFTSTEGKNPATVRVMGVVAQIASTMRETRYVHSTRVNVRRGQYDFDCSGMVGWVLARSAPRAWAVMHTDRALAADFVNTIVHATTRGSARTWQRVAKLEDAGAGDVLAWKRPAWFPSPNTGHVVILMAAPVRVFGTNLFLVRVVDSTRGGHGDDARAGVSTGFGVGTLLIPVNADSGEGTGYGWFGARTGWVVPTTIVVGRPVS